MANRINLNQTSYHGAGAIEEIANEAKAHGFKKAFVCSDPDLVKFHVTSKVTDILEKNGLAYILFTFKQSCSSSLSFPYYYPTSIGISAFLLVAFLSIYI